MTSPWHGTADWEVGQLVTAADLNAQVRDNVGYLFARPVQVVTIDRGSDFSSGSTSFVNIHTDELALTIDLAGTRARVGFVGHFRIQTSGAGLGRLCLDVSVDGVRAAGDDGICSMEGISDVRRTLAFQWVVTGLTPGTHTFRLQWKAFADVGTPTATLYAGAGTSGYDLHPQFSVEEF